VTASKAEPLPGAVLIGSVTYLVTADPDDWMRIEHQRESKGDYGCTDNTKATIYISPESTPDVQRQTLWHEVMHALCETVIGGMDWRGLGKDRYAREETVIRMLESPIVMVLRENPELVNYLMADR
jgi:hypothetical protein